MKNKIYCVVAISCAFLMHAMEDRTQNVSCRNAILNKLPQFNASKRESVLSSVGEVITYTDDAYVKKFLELAGATSTKLDARDETTQNSIQASLQVRTGDCHIHGGSDVCLSTGFVYECVAVGIRHAHPHLVALYHYFQYADEDFAQLYEFLSAVQDRATQLHIDTSDLATVLVSSYVSPNLICIKRALESKNFNAPLCYVRPHAHLYEYVSVKSSECDDTLNRLLLVRPSEFKVHAYHPDDSGRYDLDVPGDDCIIS